MALHRAAWALGLLAALDQAALTQTGRLVPTLESLLAPADRVFTGKVVKTERSPIHNVPGEPDYRQNGPENLYRYTLTVSIEKEIKGNGPKSVLLQFDAQDDSSFWKNWVDPQHSYLWSVGGTDMERWGPLSYTTHQNASAYGSLRWLALDIDRADDCGSGSYGCFTLPCLTEKLDVVKSHPEALAAAASFSHANPSPIPLVGEVMPRNFVSRQGISPNAYPFVTFPKNSMTEASARRLIEHPGDFAETAKLGRENVRASEIMVAQEAGIRLLHNFKSNRNARFLEKLFKNGYFGYATPTTHETSFLQEESRAWRLAYDTLKAWGAKVDL